MGLFFFFKLGSYFVPGFVLKALHNLFNCYFNPKWFFLLFRALCTRGVQYVFEFLYWNLESFSDL